MGLMKNASLFTAVTALCALACLPARAEVLPLLLGMKDPWNSERNIAAYGKKLKPATCPALPQKGQKLAMNDVVIAVLCHNTATRTDYLSLLSAADSYVSNYSEYLPTITSLSASKSYETNYQGVSQNSFAAGASKSTPQIETGLLLYDFGQREARLDSAEQTLLASGLSYNSSLQSTIATAISSYYDLLSAQYAVEVAYESYRVTKQSFDAASLRYKLGLIGLVDKLQASASHSSSLLDIESQENALSQSRASLAILMGLPPDAEFEVIDPAENSLAIDPFNGKAKELMEFAKTKRLDLEIARVNLNKSRLEQKAARRANRATIRADANMNFDDLDVANNSTTRSQTIGVTLTIPIFNGFVDTYNERITKRDIYSQQLQLEQTERDVERDVFVAWQNYETAKRSWEVNKEQLEVTTKLQDIAIGRYKEGLNSILEVLDAQSSYISALNGNRDARYNLLKTRLDLVRAVGILNLETMDPRQTADGTPAPVHNNPLTQPALD